MSEIYHRYQRGESIPATDLGDDAGLRLYGEIIHFEWRLDRATMQLDINNEVHIQKVHPVETEQPSAEQQHLARPSDVKIPII